MSTSTSPRSGILLTRPFLHDPTPSNAATFLRWSKIHFRDVVGLNGVLLASRFTSPAGAGKGKEHEKILYTYPTKDISFVKTKEYFAMSRQLDLENVMELREGEEKVLGEDGVGKGEPIFALVGAEFAILEEVDGGATHGNSQVGSFQSLPSTITSPKTPPPSMLITLDIKSAFPASSASPPDQIAALQTSLLDRFSPLGKLYVSLYHYAGVEAQPEAHPLITCGEWYVQLLIVDEKEGALKRENVEEEVKKWLQGVNGKDGLEVNAEVWDGETFLTLSRT